MNLTGRAMAAAAVGVIVATLAVPAAAAVPVTAAGGQSSARADTSRADSSRNAPTARAGLSSSLRLRLRLRVRAKKTARVGVLGLAGIPNSGVRSVKARVTASSQGHGAITIWPTGRQRPSRATLSIRHSHRVSATITKAPGPSGAWSVRNGTAKRVTISIVVLGYTSVPTQPSDVKIAAAGDLCSGTGTTIGCRYTSDAILANFDQYYKVLTLGDNQYPDGQYADFLASYHPHWGRLGAKIAPTMGNHDAGGGGQGYYDYFNGVGVSDGVAGKRGDGWYSYDTGDSPTSGWHIVALNSECVGKECGTRQLAWLQKDLAASTKPCTVAYLHKPRFSSGSHGDDSSMQPFWDLLNQYKAEMMVAGHDHTYERQAPRNAAGARDDANGVRQFVAGTGGKSLYSVGKGPYTEAFDGKTYGYLELTLRANSYDWRFIPSNNPGNGAFTDSGSANCH